MSLITDSLNNIFSWLQQNNPTVAASLQSGLSYREIENKLSSLQFRLPQELYELYQWRNGSNRIAKNVYFFKYYRFLPLEESLKILFNIIEKDTLLMGEIFPYGWFPIFAFGNEYYGVIGSEIAKKSSLIVYVCDYEDISYTSLTGMMQTIAECYQTGVYYLNEEGFGKTKQEAEDILIAKYNPGVLTSSHYGEYNGTAIKKRQQIITKGERLKITNIYTQDCSGLINTQITDYKNNLSKTIEYLGGKAIYICTSKIKVNSCYDSYDKTERFYSDYEIYEFRAIGKRKYGFLWKVTKSERDYINNYLKRKLVKNYSKIDFSFLLYLFGLFIVLFAIFIYLF